jgi:hypothetical protein
VNFPTPFLAAKPLKKTCRKNAASQEIREILIWRSRIQVHGYGEAFYGGKRGANKRTGVGRTSEIFCLTDAPVVPILFSGFSPPRW